MDTMTVQVHQTVHGYRNGHQLLRASRPLTSEVRRTMLVQSDLSGPSVVPGFEEYLTGYPLEDVGSFVIARTWYAPEMDRPGCVWTHSLLVEFSDLARLEDPRVLSQHFRRPSRESVADPALAPITVATAPNATPLSETGGTSSAASILAALYGSPESIVVVTSPEATSVEPLVLAIWSHQWPRLRRSFRFCTGALSIRSQDRSNFDLLVVPTALHAQFRRDAPNAIFVERGEVVDPYWIFPANQTLDWREQALSRFFWSYGADVKYPRRAWRGLVDCFVLVGGPDAPQAAAVVATLASRFPSRDDAYRLKLDLLGEAAQRLLVGDVLRELATSGAPDAFDSNALGVEQRARSLWQSDRAAASSLLQRLVSDRLNVIGEKILAALCEAVGPAVAVELEQVQRGMLALVVSRSPSLAKAPAVWRVEIDRQREVLDVLRRAGPDHVRAAVAAMISGGASELANDVSVILGSEIGDAVLAAIDQGETILRGGLSPGWRATLARNPNAVAAWLQKSNASADRLALTTEVLDPQQEVARSVPVSRWLALATGVVREMAPDARLRACAFLLSIGFASPLREASALVAMTYDEVFQVAQRKEVPYGLWRWLDELLPPLKWWRNWNHGERLSLGLVERFCRNDWPLADFGEATRDPAAFRQALSVSDYVRDGELTRRLRAALANEHLQLSRSQRELLTGG